MYSILKNEIKKTNYNTTKLAALIGVTEKTLKNKINGKTEFHWFEILKIHIIIAPHLSLEELFKKDIE